MEQFLQAVDIALDPFLAPPLRQQAVEYLEELKRTPDAWSQCFPLLQSDSSEAVKLLVLQIIDAQIPQLPTASLELLKNMLMEHFSTRIVPEELALPKSAFLRNKYAATFALLFSYAYPEVASDFFSFFAAQLDAADNYPTTLVVADYYTRVLALVHAEIGDQIYQDQSTVSRANALKDAVRARDIERIMVSIKGMVQVLRTGSEDAAPVLAALLRVIGGWASWCDIALVVDDAFLLDAFFGFFEAPMLRPEVAAMFGELLLKKMPSAKKMELLETLRVGELLNSGLPKLLDAVMAASDSGAEADPSDLAFCEALAKLLNTAGLEYLMVVEKPDLEQQTKQQALEKINTLLGLVLQTVANDYDDVALAVFPFVLSFLTILRKLSRQNQDVVAVVPTYLPFLGDLLVKIVRKMKYDDSDDGADPEDDDGFLELRDRLKVFQEAVAALAPDLFVDFISDVIGAALFQKQSAAPELVNMFANPSWRTFELGVYELTNLSEILRVNTMRLPKNAVGKLRAFAVFQSLLMSLVERMSAGAVETSHELIQVGFLELIVRHYTFFTSGSNVKQDTGLHGELTNRVLGIINLKSGLFHKEWRVRKQCCYLFSRFIKLTKPLLDAATLKTLIATLQELLAIKAQVDPDNVAAFLADKDRTAEEEPERVSDPVFESQSNLFEALGLLVLVRYKDAPNDQEMLDLMDCVLEPLFSGLQQCVEVFPGFSHILDRQQVLAQTHHCLCAAAAFAKGFEVVQSNAAATRWQALCAAAVSVVTSFLDYEVVRDAARLLFSRVMALVAGAVKDELQGLLGVLLRSNVLSLELSGIVSFVAQMVFAMSKDARIYTLLDEMLPTLLELVYKVLASEKERFEGKEGVVGRGAQERYNDLLKGYLGFLIALVNNHVLSLLVRGNNAQILPVVLQSVFDSIKTQEDTMVAKMALNVLENFVEQLGGGVLADKEDKAYGFYEGLGEMKVEGVEEYLLKESVGTCFELPFTRDVSAKDGKLRLLLFELAFVFKLLYKQYKDVLMSYLEAYFGSINFPQQFGTEFVQALMGLDDAQFKKWYVEFVGRVKSANL